MEGNWFACLKKGLVRTLPEDRLACHEGGREGRWRLGNLQPFILRHWRSGLAGAGLILLASLLGFPQPLILRYIVDDVILAHRMGLLVGAVILLAMIAAAGRCAAMLQDFHFTRFEQEVILDIQQELFDRTLRFPKAFFDENQTGYLMARLSSDVQDVRWFFSSTIVHIAGNALRCAGGIALLFYLEWRLALGVLLILPVILLGIRYFSRKIRILGHHGMERQAAFARDFQESLASVPLIKAFSSEDRTAGRLTERLRDAFRILLEQSAVSSLATLAVETMPGIARCAVLLVGAVWVIRGEWSLGSLLAFQAYLGYVFGPAQFLATANMQMQKALAALERVGALFDILPEENIGKGERVRKLHGEIDLMHVSFSYDGRDPVLRDICVQIRPGEHLAITGQSGAGKTTLLSLILCLYRPTAGEVCFDGKPADSYEVRSLRERIGFVSQRPYLVSGTIMENLRYGNPIAREEQVIRAARAARIHEFIAGLPSGYDTRIGENGVNLSEGQRQRLSIARALVRDPDILVLDEPTSAVDALTEDSILSGLPVLCRQKTVIVVTDRPATLKDADRILLLDEHGRAFVGTHGSLFACNEYYRSLVACNGIPAGPGPSLSLAAARAAGMRRVRNALQEGM